MFWRGIGPYTRLSGEFFRLSPNTKYSPSPHLNAWSPHLEYENVGVVAGKYGSLNGLPLTYTLPPLMHTRSPEVATMRLTAKLFSIGSRSTTTSLRRGDLNR